MWIITAKKNKVFDDTYYCRFAADTGLLLDYRSRGIWSKMNKFGEKILEDDDYYFSYNATSNSIVIQSYLKNRVPRFPFPVYIGSRINNKFLHFWKKKSSRKQIVNSIGSIIRNVVLFETSNQKSVFTGTLEEAEFNSVCDQFWSKVSREYCFIIDRNNRYVNWRYNDIRGGKYIRFFAFEDEVILGMLVLRINYSDNDYPVGSIVDIITFPDRPDVYEELLKKANEYFDHMEINRVNKLVLQRHPFEQIDIKYGFHPVLQVGSFLAPHRIGDRIYDLIKQDPDQYHFQLSDLDWI